MQAQRAVAHQWERAEIGDGEMHANDVAPQEFMNFQWNVQRRGGAGVAGGVVVVKVGTALLTRAR
jgi:hypothetical protein